MDKSDSWPLKRIAAIHDISGFGKCSLTVALPIISATGVECPCIPTALLSTHTGEFDNYTFHDLSREMLPIAEHWQSLGLIMDGIYSGYLASPEQEKILEQIIGKLSDERTLVVIDPVMADNGRYYSALDDRMCEAFRRLCSLADVITPNITEAALLAGMPYEDAPHSQKYIEALLTALAKLCGGIIAITGVRTSADEVGSVALDVRSGKKIAAMRPLREGVFYGTGDLFASSLAALLVRGASIEDALELSMSLVSDSIDRTCKRATPRKYGVDFESALPAYIRRVSDLFESFEYLKGPAL